MLEAESGHHRFYVREIEAVTEKARVNLETKISHGNEYVGAFKGLSSNTPPYGPITGNLVEKASEFRVIKMRVL